MQTKEQKVFNEGVSFKEKKRKTSSNLFFLLELFG